MCCLLGVRQATPNGAVLLETGEWLLWVHWLVYAGRLWNRLLAEPQGSLLQRVLTASLQLTTGPPADLLGGDSPGQRSWQRRWQLAAVGMPMDCGASVRSVCRSSGSQHWKASAGGQRSGNSPWRHQARPILGHSHRPRRRTWGQCGGACDAQLWPSLGLAFTSLPRGHGGGSRGPRSCAWANCSKQLLFHAHCRPALLLRRASAGSQLQVSTPPCTALPRPALGLAGQCRY